MSEGLSQAGSEREEVEPLSLIGLALVRAERLRQLEREGWTPEHDDKHKDGALARAAAVYALGPDVSSSAGILPYGWPFEPASYKPTPHDRIRELTKAGALVAAEIERLWRSRDS